jgi:hypothetical protein
MGQFELALDGPPGRAVNRRAYTRAIYAENRSTPSTTE